jgi:hypothetical protein
LSIWPVNRRLCLPLVKSVRNNHKFPANEKNCINLTTIFYEIFRDFFFFKRGTHALRCIYTEHIFLSFLFPLKLYLARQKKKKSVEKAEKYQIIPVVIDRSFFVKIGINQITSGHLNF